MRTDVRQHRVRVLSCLIWQSSKININKYVFDCFSGVNGRGSEGERARETTTEEERKKKYILMIVRQLSTHSASTKAPIKHTEPNTNKSKSALLQCYYDYYYYYFRFVLYDSASPFMYQYHACVSSRCMLVYRRINHN